MSELEKMKAELEKMKKEKSQVDELEKVKADLEKMKEEKSQVDARVLILEETEARRNSRWTKHSRDRVISFNSSIPEKSAKREVRLSNQETKANSERKRQESVFTRRDVQFVR